jgi:RNA-binding protein NOB1
VEDAEEEEDEDEVDELDEDDFPALRSGFEGVQLGGADGDAVEEVVQVEDQRQQDQRHKESADEATDPAEQIEANRPTLEESYRPSVGTSAAHASTSTTPLYAPEEPTTGNASDSDGEWITPGNVSHHKSLDLGLIPAAESSAQSSSNAADQKKKKVKGEKHIPQMKAACMTGDYAVQNVLLQMGLNLVGEQGKRIGVVKSWVLRCHACFK